MSKFKIVGTNVTRVEAFDKVIGGYGYPINVKPPGMLYGKILHSPVAHARIAKIDTARAEKLPGVKAVVTYKDAPRKKYNPIFIRPSETKTLVRDVLILEDRVRYVGDPVAAVAATSEEAAEEALELIDVEYEQLSSVFDPEEAMKPNSPKVHDADRNIAKVISYNTGDVEKGFKEADMVFEGRYTTPRVSTCVMEPHVCVSIPDAYGNLTLWSSTQHIYGLREKLAYALDLPVSRIKVARPPYIGGGFGSKLDMNKHEPISALLALKTRLPVRVQMTRSEVFHATHRHRSIIDLKTGVKKNGTFSARQMKAILDTGAHCTHSPIVMECVGLLSHVGSYKSPNIKFDGYCVYTNNLPGGGYRGYGGPQAYFAIESQMDEIAEELHIDPLQFRLQNAPKKGEPYSGWGEFSMESYGFEECVERGAKKFGWEKRRKPASDSGHIKRGMGVACVTMWDSCCLGFPESYELSGAYVKINVDGTVNLSVATIDVGGGQSTVLAQIVAEELGVPLSAIRFTQADTETVPFDAPTHANRVTYSAGNAVRAAAAQAKKRLKEVAAKLLEANPEDLDVSDGRVLVKGIPSKSVSVGDVEKAAEWPYVVAAEGGAHSTFTEKGSIIGAVSMQPPSNPNPAVAEFAEVEVDTETGEVRVLRVVSAHDIGKAIFPPGAEGQIEGGYQQGMGYALMEDMVIDRETGTLLTADFLDYKMPTAMEMPAKIESLFIETNEPTGPFGAKSLSEPCVITPAPAIANAIYNAIGVRIRDLPITPERILAALNKI